MSASTPSDQSRKRVRTRHFALAKESGHKITGLTSYDTLTAKIFDEAGIDFLLVGDSAGNTVLGYDSTLPVTVDELIPLARAVATSVTRAFVIADLPFGSYEEGPEQALRTAMRFMKETHAHAVKLEGGVRSEAMIRRIVDSGIPVMGHVGFTPQSEHGLGGMLVQGRGSDAERVLADAQSVEKAGAFAVVLEMVPAELARSITATLSIPTISVGAGPHTDGQLMVWTDFAGLATGRMPTFVKQYANLAQILGDATQAFREDVQSGVYPSADHCYTEDTARAARD
jgi:3-methyl-2-oxobutanoate hydroxymethyltransferase